MKSRIKVLSSLVGLCLVVMTQTASPQNGIVKIPAGSCASYAESRGTGILTINADLRAFNANGPIRATSICQLPIPENVIVRRFTVVGSNGKGEIQSEIASISENDPSQGQLFASVGITLATPAAVPGAPHKKMTVELPAAGPKRLFTGRSGVYFIVTKLTSRIAADELNGPVVFYYEIEYKRP